MPDEASAVETIDSPPRADVADQLMDMLSVGPKPPPAKVEGEEGDDEGVEAEAAAEGEAEAEEEPLLKEEKPKAEVKQKVDPLKAALEQIEGMRKQIETLSAKVSEPTTTAATAAPVDEYGPIFNDDDFEGAMSSTEGFNKAGEKLEARATERLVKGLPKVLTNIINSTVEQRLQIELFFHDNKELLPHRNYMKVIATELLEKDPAIAGDLNNLLVTTATELKQRLSLGGGRENGGSAAPSRVPRQARVPGSRDTSVREREPENEIEKQLREMLSINKRR